MQYTIGYPPETHFKLKSRKISYVHNTRFSRPFFFQILQNSMAMILPVREIEYIIPSEWDLLISVLAISTIYIWDRSSIWQRRWYFCFAIFVVFKLLGKTPRLLVPRPNKKIRILPGLDAKVIHVYSDIYNQCRYVYRYINLIGDQTEF